METLTVWRMWPRQIASDLRRFFHCRIADWHRGEISSYELLELFGASVDESVTLCGSQFDADTPIVTSAGMATVDLLADEKTRTIRVDFPPEDGAVAAALRGDERPEWKQMLAQTANSLAILRVVQAPDADTDTYGERLFLPIERQRELADEQQAMRDQHQRLREPGSDDGGLGSLWQQKEVS